MLRYTFLILFLLMISVNGVQAAGDELVCNFICAHDDGDPIGIGDADISVGCDQNFNPGVPANTPTENCHFEAQQACADVFGVSDYEEVQVESLGCRQQPKGERISGDFDLQHPDRLNLR